MLSILLKKELKSYFTSPLAYIVAGIFSMIIGWIFFNSLAKYIAQVQAVGPLGAEQISFDPVIFSIFGNMNFLFLFIIPLVTMRLFSEEKKNKTIQALLAAPLSDMQIILSKYWAGFFITMFMVSLTLIFPIILYFSGLKDMSFFASSYLALTLNILLYVSIGLFASCLTENQMVSAIISVFLIMGTWMLTWVSQISSNYYFVEFFRYVGLNIHFEMVAKGILNMSDICYYLSFVIMMIFLTKKVLEERHW